MSSPTTIQIINSGIPIPGVFIIENTPGQKFGGLVQIQLSSVIPSYSSNNLYKIFISGGANNRYQPFPTNFLGSNSDSEVVANWADTNGNNINGLSQSITQNFPPALSGIYFLQADSTYVSRTELQFDLLRYVYTSSDGALFNLNNTSCNLWLTYIPVA
jgi:hypothetical protein